ncbi:Rv1733c family protein [Streptomyces niger]|uniref:Rv1733c family protein n=1 Tax=Streptomyces niger TaxID=66373 RepID=UPI00069BFCB2|nr:hypothetical protein [Streptomyces niger]
MGAQGSPYASGPYPPHQDHPSKGANPLRRTSDRIESWLSRFLMLILAIGLPAASLSAGLTAYESSLRTVHVQSAQRHEVTARLTSHADEPQDAAYAKQRAQVRWTDKNGAERTGTAMVKSGTPEGATVRIWLDRDGTITGPPMTAHSAMAMGWMAGGGTAVAVAAGLFAARAGMRLALDRRRYAQWDAEWDLVEPRWSARFRQ